jgi:hypothetical protein
MTATGYREAAQLDERGRQSPTPDAIRSSESIRRKRRIEAAMEREAGEAS